MRKAFNDIILKGLYTVRHKCAIWEDNYFLEINHSIVTCYRVKKNITKTKHNIHHHIWDCRKGNNTEEEINIIFL